MIITFFGVIASIVVIGNLTQVYRIEDRFKENQNILQGKLNDIKKLTIELHEAVCKLAGFKKGENIYEPLYNKESSKRIDYYTTEYGVGYKGSH